jgi:Uncharacterized protein conserved in bacteria
LTREGKDCYKWQSHVVTFNQDKEKIMKCPVCDENLREIDKYGVHIDICPGCKGMWLDRGEL